MEKVPTRRPLFDSAAPPSPGSATATCTAHRPPMLHAAQQKEKTRCANPLRTRLVHDGGHGDNLARAVRRLYHCLDGQRQHAEGRRRAGFGDIGAPVEAPASFAAAEREDLLGAGHLKFVVAIRILCHVTGNGRASTASLRQPRQMASKETFGATFVAERKTSQSGPSMCRFRMNCSRRLVPRPKMWRIM